MDMDTTKKRGRKPKLPEEKMGIREAINFSPSDHLLVVERAKAHGKKVVDFIRQLAISGILPNEEFYQDINLYARDIREHALRSTDESTRQDLLLIADELEARAISPNTVEKVVDDIESLKLKVSVLLSRVKDK